MSATANVQSLEALVRLRSELTRFGARGRDALSSAEREIRRTQEWLRERQLYWEAELRRSDDPRRRAAAERELATIRMWAREIQQAANAYERQAHYLTDVLADDVPRATALLGGKIRDLESYLAATTPSAGPSPQTSSFRSASPQAAVVGDQAFTSLREMGAVLSGAAVALAHWIGSETRDAPGSNNEADDPSRNVADLHFREVQVSPRWRSFAHILIAMGPPAVIQILTTRETGTNSQDEAIPPDARSGDAEDRVDAVLDPTEPHVLLELTALTRELGMHEDHPLVFLYDPKTGLADIYNRAGDVDEWRLRRRQLPLPVTLIPHDQPGGQSGSWEFPLLSRWDRLGEGAGSDAPTKANDRNSSSKEDGR